MRLRLRLRRITTYLLFAILAVLHQCELSAFADPPAPASEDRMETERESLRRFVDEHGEESLSVTDGKNSFLITKQRIPELSSPVKEITFHILVDDDELAWIASFHDLEKLTFDGIATNKGFTRLSQLTKLTYLKVHAPSISDDGAALVVEKLKNLRHLDLSGSSIGPRTLAALAGLKQLRVLVLKHSGQIRDADLKPLEQLMMLESVSLSGNRLEGEGLSYLVSPRLKALDVADNPLDDNALKHIAQMQNLVGLNLSGTNVSDKGIRKLYGLKHLSKLLLDGVPLSHVEVARLKQALPDVLILGK